ncbi:gag-pol polyprotein [Tanacetum coccineum]
MLQKQPHEKLHRHHTRNHTITTTTTSTETIVDPPPSGRPKRKYKSTKSDDFVYSCHANSFSSFIASVHRLHEPGLYRDVVFDQLWQVAMFEELIKTKSDRSIERYKTRLVAKGYAQEYGMDYEETFALVANITTVRTLIAVASSRKWKIAQLDAKMLF